MKITSGGHDDPRVQKLLVHRFHAARAETFDSADVQAIARDHQ